MRERTQWVVGFLVFDKKGNEFFIMQYILFKLYGRREERGSIGRPRRQGEQSPSFSSYKLLLVIISGFWPPGTLKEPEKS